MRKIDNNQSNDVGISMHVIQLRALNPRFYFVHARIAGTKPRFLTKNGIKNRGFRALIQLNLSFSLHGVFYSISMLLLLSIFIIYFFRRVLPDA
jgi:hypothetical protein